MADMDPGLRREDDTDRTGVNLLNEAVQSVSHLTDGAAARCFPKSHRPFIPQAGLGQIILGKVGDLAVRSSPLGSRIGRSRQYLVRHALSKDATGQVFATR
jgi:hypothetical protein